jgi:hypothetical protein
MLQSATRAAVESFNYREPARLKKSLSEPLDHEELTRLDEFLLNRASALHVLARAKSAASHAQAARYPEGRAQ